MEKRIFVLTVLILMGVASTRAFAQNTQSNSPITRAGAVALMVEADPALKPRLQFFIKHKPPMPLFDDVDYNQWYAPYIETAFEAGLITGNAEARFRPGAWMSQEESIALANRFYALRHPGTKLTVQVGQDWVTSVISQATQNGMQLPSPVQLGTPVSRASFLAMMQSSGVNNPEQIALSNQPPAPVIVTAPPAAPRPTYTTTYVPAVAPRPTVVQRPTYVAQTAPAPVPSVPVSAGFSISLPTLGISNLKISHPANPSTHDGLLVPLQTGVGHLFGYPGGGGTILIYGHSSGYSWDVSKFTKIFRQINKLAVGDKVTINYSGKQYIYQVTYKNSVPANDMSAYKGGNGEELILYTCWPPDSIKERYLVHAVPVSEVAAR